MSWTPNWRCRHGFHRFVFVSMDNVREISAWSEPPWWVCHLVERCGRCGLTRDNPTASKPKRVKVDPQVVAEEERA